MSVGCVSAEAQAMRGDTAEAVPVGSRRSGAEWTALLAIAAVWPVWAYLVKAYTTPGADSSPALVFVLAIGWAAVQWWPARGREGSAGAAPLVLLLGYAVAYAWLPPLARATWGLAALGVAVVGLPGVGFRRCSGVLALLILAAPSADTAAFFLGAPIRAASAVVAAACLSMGGAPASAEGAMLRIGGQLFSVDAPCSGVNGLWTGMVAAACLALFRRLGPARTIALVAAAAALCIPANGWRAASLAYLSRLSADRFIFAGEAAHSAVGVVVFAATVLALAAFAGLLARRGAPDTRDLGDPQSVRPPRRAGWRRWSTAAMLSCAAAAAAAPLAPREGNRSAVSAAFPGWPAEWLGRPLQRLPETELDRRWASLSPAPIARFALADGGELLLRWTDRAGRWLHPPEDCYRGNGYEVKSLPPISAAAPGHAELVVWRRFEARKGAERLEVSSVILSAAGPAYPDPAWWWWRVAGPGAADPGPWWVATVQR